MQGRLQNMSATLPESDLSSIAVREKKKNINSATILNRGKQTLQTWYYTAGMRPQCPFPIKAGDAVVVQKRLRCCVSSSDSLGRVWLYEWRLPFRAPCLQAESGA